MLDIASKPGRYRDDLPALPDPLDLIIGVYRHQVDSSATKLGGQQIGADPRSN